jgi:hypothetical protein
VRDQDIRSEVKPGSSGLQVLGEPGNYFARTTRISLYSRGVCHSKYHSIAATDLSNSSISYFGPLVDNQ